MTRVRQKLFTYGFALQVNGSMEKGILECLELNLGPRGWETSANQWGTYSSRSVPLPPFLALSSLQHDRVPGAMADRCPCFIRCRALDTTSSHLSLGGTSSFFVNNYSTVNNTCCSCRGLGFGSQNPHGSSYPSLIPAPGERTPSHTVHIHRDKTLIHIK